MHRIIQEIINVMMVIFYIMGILIHINCLYQTKEYGGWLYFVEGEFRIRYNIPITICLISTIIEFTVMKKDEFQKYNKTVIIGILIIFNVIGMIIGYYFYCYKTITVTFTGQSLFISTTFIVIGNLMKALKEGEKDEIF
ncbi:hypothetical protein EDI_021940 [Entamoeba dispar SAW760]|uniref:Uncharacterized protein n=1 Tax=Entamoeba dispar (strain ATCC PRA-260 / SAW760) TaxID=370354 RepID=B0E9Y0_ENTDS|nr:uncharacterized protein EDI_021940 [Entamoeba dispar SAW760]EDR28665.1 hypothetical protein EDI_021940 [Entamoeba dispar SAW760]|eukprot:EDR28665.1 hypothetical protein EDI_021940 [Entamoeba dispar SAW760]